MPLSGDMGGSFIMVSPAKQWQARKALVKNSTDKTCTVNRIFLLIGTFPMGLIFLRYPAVGGKAVCLFLELISGLALPFKL